MNDIVATDDTPNDDSLDLNGLNQDAIDQAQRKVFKKLNEVSTQVRREHPENLRGEALRSKVYWRIGNGDKNRGERKVQRLIAALSVHNTRASELVDRALDLE